MHTVRTLIARYSAFIWALLKPLGAWGVVAIAAVDASFLGLPLDPVVGGYVYANPHRFWIYVLGAAAGSALGSIVLYVIGYKGGELLLEKRVGKARLEQIRDRFEKQEFLALMIPSMMPPPFPFKVFVLAAAVFEMKFRDFLLAIFLGRVARFMILSVLVLTFGPEIITLAGRLLSQHPELTIIVLAAMAIIGLLWWRGRGRKEATK